MSKLNLIKKKKMIKDIDAIKKCNHSASEFLEYLKDRYSFSEEELENLRNTQQHLINMNVIFQQIQESMK